MPLFPSIKFLKVALPATTLTVATIVTATLLFSSKEDLKLTNLNEVALQSYDKELETYKEEIVKQEEEEDVNDDSKGPEDTSDKPKDASNQALESKEKEGIEKPKTLKELFEEKIENAYSRESIKKLLNEPEKLVEELLKGTGNTPATQGKKDEFLKQAEELAKKFQENEKIKSVQAQQPIHPPEEEKALPPEKPAQLSDRQIDGEKSMEQPSTIVPEEKEIPPLQETRREDDSSEEITSTKEAESLEDNNHLETNDSESRPEPQGDLKETVRNEEGSQQNQSGEQDSARDINEETAGGPEGNKGGNAEETKYDIERFNLLKEQLSGAITYLGIKLG